ncbi:MAG: hypothetical protein BJ554DRAFT_5045 [Olpidium bornovanus]|uniref:Uncharacterized protein n=1 Tax=Olpidium bornovanus TaxID=278681 RepID=A0A8H8DL79_9FUNG|nr:MAG: hypothetical protein BJ554DRAFT_5045 [Olpidium bornovanus]
MYDSRCAAQRVSLCTPTSAVVIGIRGAHLVFTPVTELQAETDHKNRKALSQWWMDLTKLIRLLVKYEEI